MSEIDPSQLEGDMIPQGKYKPARELKELHEDSDLDVRGVLFNTAVLMALCVATFFAIGLVMGQFKAKEEELDKLALEGGVVGGRSRRTGGFHRGRHHAFSEPRSSARRRISRNSSGTSSLTTSSNI